MYKDRIIRETIVKIYKIYKIADRYQNDGKAIKEVKSGRTFGDAPDADQKGGRAAEAVGADERAAAKQRNKDRKKWFHCRSFFAIK